MRWLEVIEQHDVVLPMRHMRLLLLGIASLLGVIVACGFPHTAGTSAVSVTAVATLALLAGISGLWSP